MENKWDGVLLHQNEFLAITHDFTWGWSVTIQTDRSLSVTPNQQESNYTTLTFILNFVKQLKVKRT